MNQEYIKQQLVLALAKDGIFTKKHLVKLQRQKCRKYGGDFFRTIDLLKTYHKLVKSEKLPLDSARGKKVKSEIEKLLTMKHVRSLSGIVVVSVLTKPYPCPGKCLYCPTEINVPKSYLSNEPAVMRAIALNYDPYVQTIMRLKALEMEGHPTDKINIRIIGGTWSYYPRKYQIWFVSELFRACNSYQVIKLSSYKVKNMSEIGSQKWVASAFRKLDAPRTERTSFGNNRANINIMQTQNESSRNRIVEISIETRQDFINEREIKHLRKLGITKVELGVQSIYDEILKKNLRGHSVKETIRATKLLKDAGFKVSYQMMLNLYGSDIKHDKKMFRELFYNPDFKPDHLKIYPLALVKNSDLYKLYLENKFKPYTKSQLIKLLINIKKQIPYYCRIERVIRDIPAESIVEGGTKFSNMRQVLQKDKAFCKCIRCREIKDDSKFIKLSSYKVHQVNNQDNNITKFQNNNNMVYKRGMSPGQRRLGENHDLPNAIFDEANQARASRLDREPLERTTSERNSDVYLFEETYFASEGQETFLSIENADRSKLYSMLRLRIPSQILEKKKHFLKVLENSAIIREIHTYGQQIEIDKTGNASQHKGLGKLLVEEAEKIIQNFGLKKIAVIAGVGAREYFRKNDYEINDSYMTKNLNR